MQREHSASVEGIRISHPDRVFQNLGLEKVELARYYAAVGEHMLPHVEGRPLTLLRWSERMHDGKGGIFMRHARTGGAKGLREVKIKEKTKVGDYLVVEDVTGLVALAQLDILEIHTWGSREDDLEHPDHLVFDLDPGAGVEWDELVSAANEVRKRLRAVGLESWPKTTGGNGVHVVVPIAPRQAWAQCFAFARSFAQELAQSSPDTFVATMGKQHRPGKVFVDYLRNNRGSTSVAAFSIRARRGAPVSMPVSWRDLATKTNADFTLENVPARLRRLSRDPWADYFRCRQALPPAATPRMSA